MNGKLLLAMLNDMTAEELDQPIQVHDCKEGCWYTKVDVDVTHDGVIEIAIKY